jgi:hypothetical protein
MIFLYEPDFWTGHGDSGRVGGDPFREARNNAPFALVGFDIRHGSLVDAVTPLFRELKDDGTVGEIVRGGRYGGSGGEEVTLEIPGYVVVGLSLRQAQYTDQLSVTWQRWTNSGVSGADENMSRALGGGGGFARAPIRALPGHCACGVHGKSDALVDRLSLVTARPVIL